MESLAQSMAKGTYVSSGQFWPYENPPHSKLYVMGWTLGLPAAAIGVCYGLTFAPCNPLCSDCTLSTGAQMRETAPYFLGFALLMDAIAVVPGLIGMWVQKNKRPSYSEAQAEIARR